ncbi:putative non-specific phospholipase C1 [Sesbania bispinosa]|nr:putative non-specific phospholipase C1 [Sesbania bispinosa]
MLCKELINGFPQRSIFDSLNEGDFTFNIYDQDIPATSFFKSMSKLNNVVKFHSYNLMEGRGSFPFT